MVSEAIDHAAAAHEGALATLEVLRSFLSHPDAVDLELVKAARSRMSSQLLSDAWQTKLADEARGAYHLCLERRDLNTQPDAMISTTHVRALCLAIVETGTSSPSRDMDKASHAKHWARCGLQFVLCSEADEAESALEKASRLLREMVDAESIEVLEIELQIKGYQAHLAWCRGEMRQVLKHVEEAHALLEQRGGAQFLLASSRLYLSENVAFRLASCGYEVSDLGGGDFGDGTASSGGGGAPPTIERRELIRLLDLAISLLGGSAAELEEAELSLLRDKILRLRAWLCMLEDEIEMATHSLNQHSARASCPEYMMLRCALLFKSNQPAEASAQTIEWLRSDSSLSYDAASDAITLLCNNESHRTALTAVNVLSDRIGASRDDASSLGTGSLGTALSQQYSDLQERKHALLTESLPDSAAAAEHLEAILDGHCAGRLPLEESTLRTLAFKLWATGCEYYASGDLHHAVLDFERSFRFLEPTRAVCAQAR